MIEIKKKEIYEQLETGELQSIVNELVLKVSLAGDMVAAAQQAFDNSQTQQEAARNERYLKNCRQHLRECRKFRTMLQSILIDRLTAEQTESPYLRRKGETEYERK